MPSKISTSVSVSRELDQQITAACKLFGRSKSAFYADAARLLARKMLEISLPESWRPPDPPDPVATDPLEKGVLPSDSPEIRSLIRDSNALVLVRDGELMRDAAVRKQELLMQVLEMRRQSAEQEVVS